MTELSIKQLKSATDTATLINDNSLVIMMNEVEYNVWNSFVVVVKHFWSNYRTENYKEMVVNMCLQFFKILSAV